MTMPLSPQQGGFLRPFGTAWFIIEFLKGNGPEDSKRIEPDVGAPMTDIHFEYKSALHRAHARDAAEREEERGIRQGGPAFTEDGYEASAIQDDYPPAPSRVYYRLTDAGLKASIAEISDPVMTLYHYSREQRNAKTRSYIKS